MVNKSFYFVKATVYVAQWRGRWITDWVYPNEKERPDYHSLSEGAMIFNEFECGRWEFVLQDDPFILLEAEFLDSSHYYIKKRWDFTVGEYALSSQELIKCVGFYNKIALLNCFLTLVVQFCIVFCVRCLFIRWSTCRQVSCGGSAFVRLWEHRLIKLHTRKESNDRQEGRGEAGIQT